MSNRVDFSQSAEASLAIPASTVSVFFDGMLCPYLEVLEVVRGDWPEFSWAKLAVNFSAWTAGEPMTVEDVESALPVGKSACIRQVYNGCAPGAAAFSFPIFVGQIESVETKLGSSEERVVITAKDFSATLERITVFGRRIIDCDDSILFLAGVDTIFNEDGLANASAELKEYNGKSYRMFCANTEQSKYWSYADVINYLLCEYLPIGQLELPDIERLRSITEEQTVRDLDVTGLNLLQALNQCCQRIGLRFKFVPRLVEAETGQAIVFYKSGRGREVELNCQQKAEELSISKTNIAALSSKKNFYPVTHRYVGQGDFKVYEATFELVKAWDPADEEMDYDKFSPSTNPDFYKVKNVYRKWCLNEAGDYSGSPYNQGEPFDFSKIFERSEFIHKRRRFWPALSCDKQGKSLGYFLEVSFNNGQNWWQYLYAFNNLLDECGIWLSSDRLDANTWVAALKGALKFRITASVVADERLSCVVADGPVGSTVEVVDELITLPRWFKYRKVSPKSIFVNSSDSSLGQPDEVDDTDALYGFVRKQAEVSGAVAETVDVQTPYLVFDYRVGDRVTVSPESRDLLGCRRDNRSIHYIERVQMDFIKQYTNLKVVRKRK